MNRISRIAGSAERVRSVIGPRWRFGQIVLATAFLAALGCEEGDGLVAGEVRTLADAGASNPTVAMAGGEGEVLVAWVGAGGNVYLARLNAAGEPMGEPARVNDVNGDATPHEQAPAQVVSAGDVVYVVWQRKVEAPWLEFGGADLRLARSEDGGKTFAPAVTVNDNEWSSPARISFHDIEVGPDGRVYVSWIDARERDRARELAYRVRESAVAPGEHVHDISGEGAEPGTEMRMATSQDGGRTFSSSIVIDHDSCPCCRTAIAVADDGSVYTAWRKIFSGGIRDIAIARSSDQGRNFDQPHAVHADRWEFSACPHAGPSLAVDGADRVHAAWYSGVEGRQGLWYSVSTDGGGTFAEPVPVLTDDWVPPSQAKLATTGNRVFVAWDDLREPIRRVRIGRVADGHIETFGEAFEGKAPSITAAGDRVALAWLDGESVRVLTFVEQGSGS